MTINLPTEIYHQFINHVTHNFDVLVIDFLLEVVQTCFDNVTIELFGNEKFG